MKRVLLVVVLALALPACTIRHAERIPPGEQAAERNLDPGDNIVIALKNGKRYKGVVVTYDEAMLVTEDARYAWKDVDHISYKRVDMIGSTLGWIVVHALIVGAGYLAVEHVFDDD